MIQEKDKPEAPDAATRLPGHVLPAQPVGWDPFEIWRSRILEPRQTAGPTGGGLRSRLRRRRQKS